MTTLRKPALGPIVGHTTHMSCRLWMSASSSAYKSDEIDSQRSIGVIGVVKNGKVSQSDIFYFRLRREYDRTGTINLGVDVSLWSTETQKEKLSPYLLEPNTHYQVRMASLNLDDAYPDDSNVDSKDIASKLPPPKVWADKLNHSEGLNNIYAEAAFKTQPAPSSIGEKLPLSFFVGSCRYPGLLWKRKEADRIFKPMLENHKNDPVNFALMIGDQIYADLFNRVIPIGLADTYEEFQERYHTAFGSRNMQALLSTIPTYMILDDHEIEDNWSQDRLHKRRELFNWAMGAYMSYQWSHGPRFVDSYVHNLPAGSREHFKRMDTTCLFYDFSCAGYPVFVLDTRTQRYRQKKGINDNHLLGLPSLHESEPSQLDRLCAWLIDMQQLRGNIPKFIVTASVFVPNGVDEIPGKDQDESDSWPAFPNTRARILSTIVDNKIQNVVFLCGDIHCSNISKLEFEGAGKDLIAYSIVSSAFYWPFSFADGDPAGLVHDSQDKRTFDPFEIPGGLGTMHYKTWSFTQDDNFCRVNVDPEKNTASVQFFDWDGKPIVTRKQDDKFSSDPEYLQLCPW